MALHRLIRHYGDYNSWDEISRKPVEPTGRIKYKHYPQRNGSVVTEMLIEIRWFFIFTRWVYAERLVEMDIPIERSTRSVIYNCGGK